MKTNRWLRVLYGLASFGGTATLVSAAPGELDGAFGDNGLARIEIDSISDRAAGIFVQTDGKLLVGRDRDPTADDFSVLRLNPDGTPDLTFAADGRTSFNRASLRGRTFAVIQQADGNIVVAGRSSTDGEASDDLALARYLADGRPDTSFGVHGVARAGIAGELETAAVVQQSDGMLVAAGAFSLPDSCDDGSVATAMSAFDGYGTPTLIVARLAASGGHPGTIGLENVSVVAREGTDATFVVRRTGGSTGFSSVAYESYICWDWFSCADTASEDDFVHTEGELTWADGDSGDRTIVIPIRTDELLESTEIFSLSLSHESGAHLAAGYGWVEISDFNVNPGVLEFSENVGLTAWEANGEVLLAVRRTNGQSGALSVDFTTTALTATAGADFTPVSGTLHWADGDRGAKTVRVAIANDRAAEPVETFQVTLSAPTGGATLGASTAIVEIRDPVPTGAGGGGSAGILETLALGLLLLHSMCVTRISAWRCATSAIRPAGGMRGSHLGRIAQARPRA